MMGAVLLVEYMITAFALSGPRFDGVKVIVALIVSHGARIDGRPRLGIVDVADEIQPSLGLIVLGAVGCYRGATRGVWRARSGAAVHG